MVSMVPIRTTAPESPGGTAQSVNADSTCSGDKQNAVEKTLTAAASGDASVSSSSGSEGDSDGESASEGESESDKDSDGESDGSTSSTPASASSDSDDDGGDEKLRGKTSATEIRHAVALAAVAASDAFGWKDTKVSSQRRRRAPKALPTTFMAPATEETKTSQTAVPVAKKGNHLSHLIPGYVAPMRLESKSLDGKVGLSLSELISRAERTDASTRGRLYGKDGGGGGPAKWSAPRADRDDALPAPAPKKGGSNSMSTAIRTKRIPTTFASTFKTGARKKVDPSAGSGWFGMMPNGNTEELKTDLAVLRNRNYIDPKKFFKSSDGFAGKVLQVGTVVEGSSEFFSGRLTKRERRANFTEELMADSAVTGYAKRKYKEATSKGGGGKKRGGNKRGRRGL